MDKMIFERAQSAVIARDFDLAVRLYKTILQSEPSNIEVLKALASTFIKSGNDQKALPFYEKILEILPEDIDSMNSMGGIYRRLKEYDKSIAILTRAQNLNQRTAEVNYNMGFTYREMGKYDEAIECFESVVAVNPSDVLAFNHLGAIYAAKKDYVKAIQSYKRGLQTDPNHPILHYNMAKSYEAQGNFEEASKGYNMALKAKPGWIDAMRDYIKLLIKCSETRTAYDTLQKSLQLYPQNADLNSLLGKVFVNQYDYEKAIESYSKANGLRANDGSIMIRLGEAYEKAGKIEMAESYADKAYAVLPDDKKVQKKYAHIMLSAGRNDDAYKVIENSLNDGGHSDLETLDSLFQYYICSGLEEKADEINKKITQLNPEYNNHLLEGAQRYNQNNNFEKALDCIKNYNDRKITPNPEAYNLLGNINEKLGKIDEALAAFKSACNLGGENVSGKKGVKRLEEAITRKAQNAYNPAPAVQENLPELNEPTLAEASQEHTEFDFKQMGDNVTLGEEQGQGENPFDISFDDEPGEEVENTIATESEPENEEPAGDSSVPLLAELGEDEGLNPFDDIISDTDEILENEVVEAGEKENPDDELMEEESPIPNFDLSLGKGQKNSGEEKKSEPEPSFEDMMPPPVKKEEPPLPPEPESEPEPEPEPEPEFEPKEDFSEIFKNEPLPQNKQLSEKLDNALNQMEKTVDEIAKKSNALAEDAMDAARRAQDSVRDLEDRQNKLAEERANEVMKKAEELANAAVQKAEEATQKLLDAQKQAEMMQQQAAEMEDSWEAEIEPSFDEPEFEKKEELDPFGVPFEDSFTETFSSEPEPEVEEPVAEPVENSSDEPVAEPVETPEPEVEAETELVEGGEEELSFISMDELLEVLIDVIPAKIIAEYSVPAPFAGELSRTTVGEPSRTTVGEPSRTIEGVESPEPATNVAEPVKNSESDTEETPAGFLPEIMKIFEDGENCGDDKTELELFKKLRAMAENLPSPEKEIFLASRTRLLMEYMISKLSGAPGLLATVQGLLESGDVASQVSPVVSPVETYEGDSQELTGVALAKKVISDMKGLSVFLEDKELSKALNSAAEKVLSKL